MKVKKAISITLLSCLFINATIPSFAGTLSDDGRYEAFEGSSITVNDVLEEDAVDIEIEGNTLVNLVKEISVEGGGYPEMTKSGAEYTVTTRSYGSAVFEIKSIYDLSGKDITLALNYYRTDGAYNQKYFGYYDGATYNHAYIELKEGFNLINWTVPGNDCKYFWIGNLGEIPEGTGQTISDVMILEGTFESHQLPSYFEGMKSVGESVDRTGNIKIKSKNKNLIDLNQVEISSWQSAYTINPDGSITIRPTDTTGVSYVHLKNIFLPKNKSYVFSHKENGLVGSYGFPVWKDRTTEPVDAPLSTKVSYDRYIGIGLYVDNSSLDNYLTVYPQLEEGTSPTSYAVSTSEEKELPLNEPLRGLPNGVKDRIIKKNGQWVVERNCGETLIDENSYISIHNSSSGSEYIRFRLGLPLDAYTSTSSSIIIDTYYKSDTINYLNEVSPGGENVSDKEGLYRGSAFYDNKPVCYFSILKDKLSTQNVDGLKEWLSQNPTKIVYQLATPIYEPLNIDSSVKLFEGTTYISNSSTIPANMKVTVDRVSNIAKAAIELAKTTPTVENLAQARYWTNLLKESTLKDSFQSEVDDIIEVEDLTIEEKTASANADVYIKMKNTLSLSLDTNSIIFDEVDTTEDTEMQKAVNLTVSSSLPYKVNAYLEDELYNNNKTEALDKSILNIRANGKTTYQAFTDLSTPITLLDDQEAGVDTIHGIDLRLASNDSHKADVYKTSIKFEVIQK